jgi:molybdopterin-dependent oxidoreductase alpha subunit
VSVPPAKKSTAGAAGIKALLVTIDQAQKQTGLLRGLRVLGSANQEGGFDCPGCAWPDPAERSFAEFCENGAKAILDEATTQKVTRDFFARHSIQELQNKSERWLNAQGRLTEPMVLRPGKQHYEPISYEEALELLASTLASLLHPSEAAFYTSGRASNEAAFLYQLMVRAFGTNNLPDCSNLCHESSGIALKESLGIGKGTVRLSDFERADLIFVIGQNPGTNHPRMLSTLRDAKLRGAAIISVNPLREQGLIRFSHPQDASDLINGGVSITDHFVRPRINGDQALFRGLNKALLEAESKGLGGVDRRFIEEKTLNFSEFEAIVREDSWSAIEDQSGVLKSEIEMLANRSAKATGIICTWAMGLTQHENAVATIQEVAHFLLLTGNIGRPGAGACPVRGHSNVQGDRTVGIVPQLPLDFAQNLADQLGLSVPVEPGLDTVGTISAMAEGKVRAFIALGGNFLSACPDTEFTQNALKKCAITAQISTKLNLSHLHTGKTALLIPCLARSERNRTDDGEQFVSVENSMGIVHSSRGNLKPSHPDLLGEPSIIARLAEKLLAHSKRSALGLDWKALGSDHDKIRDLIESVVPGFTRYNERVREGGGFELPNGPREGHFTTKSGRAHFVPTSIGRVEVKPGELLLMTIRSHDQFNTTVYSDDDRYRREGGTRRIVLMNREDLHERGLKSGSEIVVTSHHTASDGKEETRVLSGMRALVYDIPRGSAAAYFPEANPLVFLNYFAERSRTPASKSIRVTVAERVNKP